MRVNGLHLYALGVAAVLVFVPPAAALIFGSSCRGQARLELAAPRGGPTKRSAPPAVCVGRTFAHPGVVPERSYGEAKAAVAQTRRRLERTCRAASCPERWLRSAAGPAFVRALRRHLMPHWCGTAWAYHGTTQVPGQGRIACGYFVTTLLRDAGLGVQRVALARRPSEAIIKSLVSARYIRRFSDVDLPRFVTAVRRLGSGLYLVGLDNHVGFLLVESGDVTFVHSSYLPPGRVTAEPALRSPALRESRYRVVGRLSGDPALLRRWLQGEPIPTR